MSILVCAFDAFAGESINPASQALAQLPATIAGKKIHRLIVPTVFGASLKSLIGAIESTAPEAVLCVGQAGGRAQITPEKIAINLIDARIPDNEGRQPVDETIAPGGKIAYFSTLPVKAMVRAMRKAQIPAALSYTAGTFVCNYLMYGLLHYLADTGSPVRGGFVHVPYLPEQAAGREGVPSMELPLIVRGLTACIEAIAAHEQDLRVSEGREC